ncbi:HpcH/HpaI aldolase/citrate lyase family protein [Variovorax sp. KK3]|uniref:HpcH/HpaI aldolase family protein n=1 Tax=Variovorax sp. KK3 TaxID=1855728 RepID=UPI0015C328BD|nr:aldolase/citrate lyase family protein [Variovorax sp. KK3]
MTQRDTLQKRFQGHPVMQRLARREPVAAFGVRMARTADVARLAKATGHHAIWIDLEHSTIGLDVAGYICAAAHDIGLMALVRVPEREYGAIGRLLDAGASGLIFPRVETAEQAADLAAACRFPPHGHRSAIAALPQAHYRRMPPAELYRLADDAVVVNVLIESPRGIDNAEAIARVPGVDLVSIGTNDLSAELGVPGEYRHPSVQQALDAALAACACAGKPLSIGGIADAALNAELLARGAVPFLMTGIDTDVLYAAMQERARQALDAHAHATQAQVQVH